METISLRQAQLKNILYPITLLLRFQNVQTTGLPKDLRVKGLM